MSKFVALNGLKKLILKHTRIIKNRDNYDSMMYIFEETESGEVIKKTCIFNTNPQSDCCKTYRGISNNQDELTKCDDILTATEKANQHRGESYFAFIEPNRSNTYNNITSIMSED